jgi:antitoxin HigA-1
MSKKPLHPALILKDFLEEYHLTQADLARGLGVPRAAISDLLKQKRGISMEMAVRLGTFFGDGTLIWTNLQREYEFDMMDQSGVLEQITATITPLSIAPHP